MYVDAVLHVKERKVMGSEPNFATIKGGGGIRALFYHVAALCGGRRLVTISF